MWLTPDGCNAWLSCGAAVAFAGWLLPAAPTHAAPFCVHTKAIPPQCIYFDPSSCNKRAIQMGGICTANEDEVKVTSGIGHYCLVTSGMASFCSYASRDTCDRDARQQQGVCIQNRRGRKARPPIRIAT